MVTSAGGTSCSEQGLDAAAFSSVVRPSTTHCYAVGGFYPTTPPGELFAITNGATWAKRTLPSRVSALSGVSCATSTTTCMAVGLKPVDLGAVASEVAVTLRPRAHEAGLQLAEMSNR